MLIDLIYQNFPALSDMRMRKIIVDKYRRRVTCELSYPDLPDLDKSVQRNVADFIRKNLPQGYAGYVSFVDDIFTPLSFRSYFSDLLHNKYPVFSDIGKEKIDVTIKDKTVYLTVYVSKSVKNSMESVDFLTELKSDFENFTCYKVILDLRNDDSASEHAVKKQEQLVELALKREILKPTRYFNITDVETYIGKQITTAPMYISDLKSDTGTCVICGKIRDKKLTQPKNDPATQICKFVLEDETEHFITCVLFVKLQITDVNVIMDSTGKGEAEAKTISQARMYANDAKMKKIGFLANNMSVVVRGAVRYSGFSSRLELIVYDLSKCKILPMAPRKVSAAAVPANYSVIFPHNYTEYKQIDFTDDTVAVQHAIFQDKPLVVVYANSTGSDVVNDKMLAICGVKIVNGKVSEKLFTYINPEQTVEQQTLDICKIAQSKLIFYPTLTEIIDDVYKFLYGCTLIGPEVETIVKVLNYYAQPLGYVFDNEIKSQHFMLTNLLTAAGVKINAGKIARIAAKCKVACPDTQFCDNVALTVARCICVLAAK